MYKKSINIMLIVAFIIFSSGCKNQDIKTANNVSVYCNPNTELDGNKKLSHLKSPSWYVGTYSGKHDYCLTIVIDRKLLASNPPKGTLVGGAMSDGINRSYNSKTRLSYHSKSEKKDCYGITMGRKDKEKDELCFKPEGGVYLKFASTEGYGLRTSNMIKFSF